MRRFIAKQGMTTRMGGFASGYYAANGQILGEYKLGGQQYTSRNMDIGSVAGMNSGPGYHMNVVFENSNLPAGVVNDYNSGLVHVGNNGRGEDANKNKMLGDSVEDGKMAEKPFIFVEKDAWFICKPAIKEGKAQSQGVDHSACDGEVFPFEQVKIVSPEDALNDTLMDGVTGEHTSYTAVVLTPGLYQIKKPIMVPRNVIILGIGFPVLNIQAPDEHWTGSRSGMIVADTTGVRLAGFIIQPDVASTTAAYVASNHNSIKDRTMPLDSLIQFGTAQGQKGVISDVFFRVFGYVDTMLEINDEHTIVDHSWLWVADHGDFKGAANHAVVVKEKARYTQLHHMFTEHTFKDLMVIEAENVRVYFQQTEFMYDLANDGRDAGVIVTADGTDIWGYEQDGKIIGYSGLTVKETVKDFKSYGTGQYMFNKGKRGSDKFAVDILYAMYMPSINCSDVVHAVVWQIPHDNQGKFVQWLVCDYGTGLQDFANDDLNPKSSKFVNYNNNHQFGNFNGRGASIRNWTPSKGGATSFFNDNAGDHTSVKKPPASVAPAATKPATKPPAATKPATQPAAAAGAADKKAADKAAADKKAADKKAADKKAAADKAAKDKAAKEAAAKAAAGTTKPATSGNSGSSSSSSELLDLSKCDFLCGRLLTKAQAPAGLRGDQLWQSFNAYWQCLKFDCAHQVFGKTEIEIHSAFATKTCNSNQHCLKGFQ